MNLTKSRRRKIAVGISNFFLDNATIGSAFSILSARQHPNKKAQSGASNGSFHFSQILLYKGYFSGIFLKFSCSNLW